MTNPYKNTPAARFIADRMLSHATALQEERKVRALLDVRSGLGEEKIIPFGCPERGVG